MIHRLPVIVISCILLNGCSDKRGELHLVPDSDGRSQLEVGYWEGDGIGIGGHMWISLAPFRIGDQTIAASEFDLNRFKIHLPYDLKELNDRTIDCNSEEFSFGPHGSLTIRPDKGEPISLTPVSIEFKRTGNQSLDMKMSGVVELEEASRPFRISAPLNIQFGYGAREPHPNEATIDKALQIAGKQNLPRWCDETYEARYDFEGWKQTMILLRPHRDEDFQRWKNELSPINDLSSLVLPQYETPEWWPTKAHVVMGEARETDVFYNEKTFTEDEEGNKTGFGLSVQIPAVPLIPSDPAHGDPEELIKSPGELEFRQIPSSKNSLGWIALRDEPEYSGSIFIFHFARNPR